jgi:hypothetical protein
MRPLGKLITVALAYATLFACSAPAYRITDDLGTLPVELVGPKELVLHMDVQLDDPSTMSCRDLYPSFEIDWAGEEGDVTLQVWAGDDRWDEDTVAEDGLRLTTVYGLMERCRFDATVLIDSATPLDGELTIRAVATRDGMGPDTTGRVTGDVELRAADEAVPPTDD